MKDWKEIAEEMRNTINDYDVEPFIEEMIKLALDRQKEEIIKRVESKMINKQVMSLDEFGYNTALDEVIKEIKGDDRET